MVKRTQLEQKMDLLRQVFAQQVIEGHWGSPVTEHLASWAWEAIQTGAQKEGVLHQRLREAGLRHLREVQGTERAVEEATAEELELAEYLSRQYPLL